VHPEGELPQKKNKVEKAPLRIVPQLLIPASLILENMEYIKIRMGNSYLVDNK